MQPETDHRPQRIGAGRNYKGRFRKMLAFAFAGR